MFELKFNTSKCKHAHFGPETNATYKMEEKNITKSDEEKDLGIIIDGKLKFRQHINIQTKKANQKLGMIKRSFCYSGRNISLGIDNLICRGEGGAMVFCFVQNFFFGQHKI
jgi:hypothetical protein